MQYFAETKTKRTAYERKKAHKIQTNKQKKNSIHIETTINTTRLYIK